MLKKIQKVQWKEQGRQKDHEKDGWAGLKRIQYNGSEKQGGNGQRPWGVEKALLEGKIHNGLRRLRRREEGEGEALVVVVVVVEVVVVVKVVVVVVVAVVVVAVVVVAVVVVVAAAAVVVVVVVVVVVSD
jgi:hypothetical protein